MAKSSVSAHGAPLWRLLRRKLLKLDIKLPTTSLRLSSSCLPSSSTRNLAERINSVMHCGRPAHTDSFRKADRKVVFYHHQGLQSAAEDADDGTSNCCTIGTRSSLLDWASCAASEYTTAPSTLGHEDLSNDSIYMHHGADDILQDSDDDDCEKFHNRTVPECGVVEVDADAEYHVMYSRDPYSDFALSIREMIINTVVEQRLHFKHSETTSWCSYSAAHKCNIRHDIGVQLRNLFTRYLVVNTPDQHCTIAFAFLNALASTRIM